MTGAHFKFADLCNILDKVKAARAVIEAAEKNDLMVSGQIDKRKRIEDLPPAQPVGLPP